MSEHQTPIWDDGIHYYTVVDDEDEHTPLFVFATLAIPEPAEWSIYRFDKITKGWVLDLKLADYLFGTEPGARTLTEEQAADMVHGWGGELATWPGGKNA